MRIYTTLTYPGQHLPGIRVEGDAGVAVWDYEDRVTLLGPGGAQQVLPPPPPGPDVVDNFLAAVRGEPVPLYSPLADSTAHLAVANGAFLSSWPPAPIPAAYREQVTTPQGTRAWTVPGIDDIIRQAMAQGRLFSEVGVPWARSGRAVDVSTLAVFAPPRGGAEGGGGEPGAAGPAGPAAGATGGAGPGAAGGPSRRPRSVPRDL